MKNWISVKEKLPEIGKSVLVYLNQYDEVSIAWRDNCLGMSSEKWRTFNSCTYADELISHWMELPEKPQSDE